MAGATPLRLGVESRAVGWLMLAVGAFAAGWVPPQASDGPPLDLIIRGGRLFDGSGNPWIRADVGIRDHRIAIVGDLTGTDAEDEIDAAGLYVAPGFIDVHSHAAAGLVTEDRSDAAMLLHQGITTVVINPDGGGDTDLAAQRAGLLEYGLGVNVAQMIGHGTVRGAVLGMEDRAPTADEMARMAMIVRRAMQGGAFGLSSGLFYTPGSYAELDEVIELGKVVAEFGGAYGAHIRDEADYTIGVVAAVDEVIEVARQARIAGVVTHVKALGPNVWGEAETIVARVDAARGEGVEVYADQYPYEASSTGLSSALLPRWSQAGGGDAQARRFADRETHARIRAAMVDNMARRGGAERIQFTGGGAAMEGRTLQSLAEQQGTDPIDVAIEIIRGGLPGSVISFNMHADDVRTLMMQPWTMTSSDGGLPPFGVGKPHPRSYGTYPRKIRKYVLEEGFVSLPAAIRSMSSLPAAAYRVADRGFIRAGAFGDIVVFDLDLITDRATYTDPHQYSEGLVHVLVNGKAALRDGRPTGTKAGIVLRRNDPAEEQSSS
ncbi:MAG TPA: amidohydrolase family protein [Acidobacteriota bacterium]|nr:amidohydrolase family protein [Acidobacteriota bacterium]